MPVGIRPNGHIRKPVRRVTDGRIRRCVVCQEKLSSYNLGPNCFAHSRAPLVRERGSALNPVTT